MSRFTVQHVVVSGHLTLSPWTKVACPALVGAPGVTALAEPGVPVCLESSPYRWLRFLGDRGTPWATRHSSFPLPLSFLSRCPRSSCANGFCLAVIFLLPPVLPAPRACIFGMDWPCGDVLPLPALLLLMGSISSQPLSWGHVGHNPVL